MIAANPTSESGNYEVGGVWRTYYVGDPSDAVAKTADEVYTIWDMVMTVYAVRNAIVHEGRFDRHSAQNSANGYEQLAAKLTPPGDLGHWIKDQAKAAVWREI